MALPPVEYRELVVRCRGTTPLHGRPVAPGEKTIGTIGLGFIFRKSVRQLGLPLIKGHMCKFEPAEIESPEPPEVSTTAVMRIQDGQRKICPQEVLTYPEWSMSVHLVYDAGFLAREELLEALGVVGQTYGIGDRCEVWNGSYGRFEIVEVKEVQRGNETNV